MCLIVFAWQQHPTCSLVLAANRDEFHRRPADAADFWADHPGLLAGRDREAGGTWMGISETGRFAAITNVRDPEGGQGKAPRSRGELTTDFLSADTSPEVYLADVANRCDAYLGFNLLVGDGQSLWYLHGGGDAPTPHRLEPGLYGLSNAALDVPWPKVSLARKTLAQILSDVGDAAVDHADLRRCVADRTLADTNALTPHGLEGTMARRLSAQFIVTPEYGTRCCTTLTQGPEGWEFQEQRFDTGGAIIGESVFRSDAGLRQE